jgi:hypothetical protein
LHRRPIRHAKHPALDVRKALEDARLELRNALEPRITSDVGDRVVAGNVLAVLEAIVEDLREALRFVEELLRGGLVRG